jgi:hypothetical protein
MQRRSPKNQKQSQMPKKPAPIPLKTMLGTLNVEGWRKDPSRIVWAQQEPMFRDLATVLINERARALAFDPTVTESVRLGRVQGYEAAVEVLRELASGESETAVQEPEQDYNAGRLHD